jgi:hypothetical protein
LSRIEKLSSTVEAAEAFVGGKSKNMHLDRRARQIVVRGPVGKAIVMGILERHGEARVKFVKTRGKKQEELRNNVEAGSTI